MPYINESSERRDSDAESTTAGAGSAFNSRTDLVYASEDLFKGVREITITHAGASYRLRITHANKLILTK